MQSQKRRRLGKEKIRQRPLAKIPTLLLIKEFIEGRIRGVKHQPLWETSERALAKIEAYEEAIDMILEHTGLFKEPEEEMETSMTAQALETRRLIQACIEQGRRISVPSPKPLPAPPPPGSFKTTPGPAQGVPYRSPYSIRNKRWVVQAKSLQAQGLKIENGVLRHRTKADDLVIIAPALPYEKPVRRYQQERKGQRTRYECRRASGICAKCPARARIKKNGKPAAYCEKCAQRNKAYQAVVRELGTEGERVVRGMMGA